MNVNAAAFAPRQQQQPQQPKQHQQPDYSRELKVLLGAAGLRTVFDVSREWTALHHSVLASAIGRACKP